MKKDNNVMMAKTFWCKITESAQSYLPNNGYEELIQIVTTKRWAR